MWPFKHDDELSKVVAGYVQLKAKNTQLQFSGILREWSKCLGRVPMNQAREIHVLKFVQEQRERQGRHGKITNWTLKRKLALLGKLYETLLRQKLVKENPFPPIAETIRSDCGDHEPTELIPFDKVKELMRAPSDVSPEGKRDRCFFALLFGGALRVSEVMGLQIGDLKLTDKKTLFVILRHTKSQKQQQQSFPDWVKDPVQEYLAQRLVDGGSGKSPLFVVYRKNGTTAPLVQRQARRIFKAWCKVVGLPKTVKIHSTRATAITKMLADGVPYREVQEFSRHASVQTVEQYDKRRWELDEAPGKNLKF